MHAVTFRQISNDVDFSKLIELAKKIYKQGEISIEIDEYEPNDETIKTKNKRIKNASKYKIK